MFSLAFSTAQQLFVIRLHMGVAPIGIATLVWRLVGFGGPDFFENVLVFLHCSFFKSGFAAQTSRCFVGLSLL